MLGFIGNLSSEENLEGGRQTDFVPFNSIFKI